MSDKKDDLKIIEMSEYKKDDLKALRDDLKDLEEKVTFNANVIGGTISLTIIALAIIGVVKLIQFIF